MYKLVYVDQVIYRDIPKLSIPVRSSIKSTIEKKLLLDPMRFGKPLRHSFKGYRSLRVGNYRVIYQMVSTTIRILAIQHRKDCYNW